MQKKKYVVVSNVYARVTFALLIAHIPWLEDVNAVGHIEEKKYGAVQLKKQTNIQINVIQSNTKQNQRLNVIV